MNDINTVIDNAFIASLNPCRDRYENYLEHYKGSSFSVEEFAALENISDSDKWWVFWRNDFLTSKDKRVLICKFAEHVLHFFENEYPDDPRPRNAINTALFYASAYDDGAAYPTLGRAAYNAALEAAEGATTVRAASAARAAVYAVYAVYPTIGRDYNTNDTGETAAAYAAEAARAAYYAAYSAAAAAAAAAADAVARAARKEETQYQINLIVKTLKDRK